MSRTLTNIIAIALLASSIATSANAQQTFVDPRFPTQWRQMGKTTPAATTTAAPHSDYAFATTHDVSDGPGQEGTGRIATMPDGTWTWSVTYASEGALSMSATLTNIEMPDEGMIVVSRGDGNSIETITNATIAKQKYVGTEIVQGDQMTIRYIGPSAPTPKFEIIEIHCGTRPLPKSVVETSEQQGNRAAYGQYGASKSCEIPAICTPSHDGPRRATCRLIVNGSYLGTGTLMNNTAFDGRPLVLTSAHVIHKLPLKTCKTLFCFEEPTCESDGIYDRGSDNISGGTLECYNERADVALIELPNAPSIASRAYYAGWNRSAELPEGSAYCFHHPGGDVKKMSVASTLAGGATYNGGITENKGVAFYSNFHWRVMNWELGLTEAGSSGSSLTDANGHVIGALTGGLSNCTTHSDDYYWQMSKAWDNVDTEDYPHPLSEILDPTQTNAMVCEGMEMKSAQGETRQLSSIDGNDDYEPSGHTLSLEEPLMTQRVTLPDMEEGQEAYIHAMSVMVATGIAYDTNPQIDITVNDTEGNTLGETEVPLASFAKDNVVQVNFSPAIRVPNGNCQIELRLTAKGFTESTEGFAPYESTAPTDDLGEMRWSGTPNTGRTLMMHLTYSTAQAERQPNEDTTNTATIWFDKSRIEVNTNQNEATVEVFTRNGQRVHTEAIGSHASISVKDMPPGLYIVRLTTSQGEKIARILIF